MTDSSIVNLQKALARRFASRLKRYGSGLQEEHGMGFTIEGIDAVFSATTVHGTLPLNHFDVQVESLPPGEYLYTTHLSLEGLLQTVEVFSGPQSGWPRFSIAENTSDRFACRCCGFLTLSEQPPGTYEICPVCFGKTTSHSPETFQ